MSQQIDINHGFIKPKDLKNVIDTINQGGIVIVPSDSGYSLICHLGDKSSCQRIRQIRDLNKDHPFTILSSDLTHLSRYARVDNVQFRILKILFPGAFTCILPASKEVPRLVQHEKRKTIGIRISDDPILKTIIETHTEALMGVSLFESAEVSGNIHNLDKSIINSVDLIINVGEKTIRPSTVIDLTQMPPEILRQGYGDASAILS